MNEASWDRIGRVVLGLALVAIGLLLVDGAWGWALTALGLVPLITGLAGWCPIYAVIGRGTRGHDIHRDGAAV